VTDHVHMVISIPPKYAVAQVIRVSMKGKRLIWVARIAVIKRTSQAKTFGPEDTVFLTIGLDDETVREDMSKNRRKRTKSWTRLKNV